MSPASATVTIPTHNDTRAPYSRRDRMSRPNSSVPNKCAAPGACSRVSSVTVYGLYGARNGAKIAATTRTRMTTAPPRAARLLFSFVSARWVSRRGTTRRSAIAHARIDCSVQQVHHQVDQRHQQRGDQDDPLDQRIVTLIDGLQQQSTYARPGENRLG